MTKYNIYMNNSLAGSVKTDNIEGYMKDSNYSKAKYRIDHDENEVFIYVDILDVMRETYALSKPNDEIISDVQGKELI